MSGNDAQAVGALGFWSAITQIVVADVSMSLDNVLAVAGAAKGHTWVLVVGLAIAVVLMAVAATYIARLAGALSLDHLGRARHRAVRGGRHDLARLSRGGVRLGARGRLPAGPGGGGGSDGGLVGLMATRASRLTRADLQA